MTLAEAIDTIREALCRRFGDGGADNNAYVIIFTDWRGSELADADGTVVADQDETVVTTLAAPYDA